MMNEEMCQKCGKMMSECECEEKSKESSLEEFNEDSKDSSPKAQMGDMAEKAVAILKKLGLSPATLDIVAKELAEVVEKGGSVAVVAVKNEEESKPTPSLYERLKNSKL